MDRITTLESFDESAQHASSTFGESVPASTGAATSFDEPIAAITSANGDKPLKENGANEVRKISVLSIVIYSRFSRSWQLGGSYTGLVTAGPTKIY